MRRSLEAPNELDAITIFQIPDERTRQGNMSSRAAQSSHVAIDMRASSSRAVASFSKIENQTLVLMGAVSVSVHGKGNLGDEPRAEVIADSCGRSAARSA